MTLFPTLAPHGAGIGAVMSASSGLYRVLVSSATFRVCWTAFRAVSLCVNKASTSASCIDTDFKCVIHVEIPLWILLDAALHFMNGQSALHIRDNLTDHIRDVFRIELPDWLDRKRRAPIGTALQSEIATLQRMHVFERYGRSPTGVW